MEGIVWYVAFVMSATLHEAAHAWAAMRGGDPTAYAGGQVSLDPVPHIRREPFGMVVLPLISVFLMGWPFGYASAPYDPQWASRHPHRAAWMAAAGPAANFLLVLLCAGAVWIGILTGNFLVPDSVRYTSIVEPANDGLARTLSFVLSVLFSMNLLMTVLNLIPLPPLDGSAAIGLLMSEEKAVRLQAITRTPGFAIIGLMLAWHIFGPLFRLAFLAIMSLMYPSHYS